MADKRFNKGYTYLVLDGKNRWYIVKQVSMKGWKALNFTHTELGYEEEFYEGNGVAMFKSMNPMRVKKVITKHELRLQMFNILKHGVLQGD